MAKAQTPGDLATGSVTLRSANFREQPEINFDWLEGEFGNAEVDALVKIADIMYRAFDAQPEPLAPITCVIPSEGADV